VMHFNVLLTQSCHKTSEDLRTSHTVCTNFHVFYYACYFKLQSRFTLIVGKRVASTLIEHLSFLFHRRKQVTQIWNNMSVSKL